MTFGAGTPYETRLARVPSAGEQVLRREIAQLLRPELVGIVEGGTAVRLKGAFRYPDGTPIPVGGKTGTGDNRSTTFDSRGNEIRSVAINRTSTFAFLIGDRFFGVLTAYVPGEQADNYGFTSSLPVAILAMLKPSLDPLILAREPQVCTGERIARATETAARQLASVLDRVLSSRAMSPSTSARSQESAATSPLPWRRPCVI